MTTQEPNTEVDPKEPEKPKTLGEAEWYHKGFLAGLAAYARGIGHSELKMNNELLRQLIDSQGWKTLETFEQISGSRFQEGGT